ncbi:MAG: Gfo/Idh/MocA family oxidoreductase [Chlorobi bacterium]|nr:Gfo/Idh/MocA family oxidoreductase [Chlorobiota bacterium]
MKRKLSSSRRDFVKKLSLGTAAASFASLIPGSVSGTPPVFMKKTYPERKISANDKIRLATIGFGIQGIGDSLTATKVSGVEFVAACDLYQGRLERAKELFGKDVFTTRDYREILSRKDIDAVIIAAPDHWHKTIAIAALNAGKAVYLEKPMIKYIEEGHELIDVWKKTAGILQVGSQGMSSVGNAKAREMFRAGAIGDLVMVEIFNDRFSSEGAWQYPVPPDASPETIDFDTFLDSAPKVPYDPVRFFRWRNYQDYGTGVAGDLFVHSFSTLHFVTGSKGPVAARSTGGIRYWKDGRDVPDILMALYDFPETSMHPAFNAILRINFVAGNGGGSGFRLIGSEGVLNVGTNKVTVQNRKPGMKPSGYSLKAYTEKMQEAIREEYDRKYGKTVPGIPEETVFQAPPGYLGAHYDHFHRFFETMRGNDFIVEDPIYGLRAAGAALLANLSYFGHKTVYWDAEKMKLT